MRVIETKAYTFDELSEQAKEKAIEKQKQSDGYLDYEWYDCVKYEFEEKAKESGFNYTKSYFSGFWSQGDGAMFEYDHLDDKLRLEFINQLNLSPMRKDWLINNTCISGKGRQSGHYYHENSCSHSIYWEVDNGDLHWDRTFYKWLESFFEEFEDFIIDKYKDLCCEYYKSLEKEYDWLMSDEQIAEHLIANEYEFNEEGIMI